MPKFDPDDAMRNLATIFTQIYNEAVRREGPKIIGVNGVDTSGKTTFSVHLARFFESCGHQVLLIHMDDFHNRREIRTRDPSPTGYLENAFDVELLANLLRSISQGDTDRTLRLLDIDADEFTNVKRYATDINTITIVEGVLLYRPPIDQFFSYRIFLEIGFEEVLRRAAARDVPKYGEGILDGYRNRYIPAQKMYLDVYAPKARCDMVIDNHDWRNPFIRHGIPGNG